MQFNKRVYRSRSRAFFGGWKIGVFLGIGDFFPPKEMALKLFWEGEGDSSIWWWFQSNLLGCFIRSFGGRMIQF